MVCDAGSVRNAAGDHRKAEYRSPPHPGASRSRRTHERDRTDQFHAGGVGGFPPQRNEAVGAGDPEAWTERRVTGTRGGIVARLSTISCRPHTLASFSPTRRSTESGPLPVGNGVSTRTGLAG